MCQSLLQQTIRVIDLFKILKDPNNFKELQIEYNIKSYYSAEPSSQHIGVIERIAGTIKNFLF